MGRPRKHEVDKWIEHRNRARTLLLSGNTINEVAEALSIAYGTVAKWKQEEKIPTVRKAPKPRNVTPAPYYRGWPGMQWSSE